MPKPIWFINIVIKYSKSTYTFDFPTCANNIDELDDHDRLYIMKKIAGSKDLRNRYLDMFSKCIITEFNKLKQIGQSNG